MQRSRVKYWEIIADRLSKAGWSLGWVSAIDCEGRTIWNADAHRADGKRFVVRTDEKLMLRLDHVAAPRGLAWDRGKGAHKFGGETRI